jgi:hypothetical protein
MLPRSPGVVRRHHLPAGHIGYFSADETTPRRRMRRVCVLDKAENRTFWSLAQNVGCANRIYGYGKEWDWDRYLSGAEPFIHEPVDRLMRDGPDHFKLDDWAKLAWYITLLFARGPDLEYEIEQRVAETGMDPRRISPGYIINAQRIGSAIVRARWGVMWSNELDLVLGDRGITGMYLRRVQAYGYFIPLRRNFGVVITAGPHPKQVRWSGQDWEIAIESSIASGNRPNMWTWLASRKQTYGPAPDEGIPIVDPATMRV